MTSTMPLLILLLVVLSASLYYIIKAEGGFVEFPRLMERVGIPLDEFLIFNFQFSNKESEQVDGSRADKFVSGDSRFSRGICEKDGDCFVGGCSSEVCSTDIGVITTCEYSDSFPNVDTFQCGCVSGVCGWSRN